MTRVQIPNSTSPPEKQGQQGRSGSGRQERGLVGWRIGSEGEGLVGVCVQGIGGQLGGRMDEWRGWEDDEWVDGWTNGWTERLLGGWMRAGAGRWMEERREGVRDRGIEDG